MQSECKCIYCVITPPLIAPEDSMLTRRTRYYDHGCILFIVTLLMLTISSCDFSQKEREIQEWSNLNKRVEELIPTYKAKRLTDYSILDKYKSVAKQEHMLSYRLFGENHLNFSTSLFHLGVLSYTKYQAEMYLEHSLEIRQRLLGANHLLVADCYEELFRALPEYQNEEILCRVLDIRKKVLGENHPKYIQTFTNFTDLGSYDNKSQAIHYMKEALSLSEKYKLDFSIREKYMNDLSNLYANQNNWNESIRINKKILNELTTFCKDSINELNIAFYMAHIARNLGRVGNFKEADSCYISSISIYEKYNNKKFTEYGLALYGRAMLMKKIGNFEEASRLYALFLPIKDQAVPIGACDFWTSNRANWF